MEIQGKIKTVGEPKHLEHTISNREKVVKLRTRAHRHIMGIEFCTGDKVVELIDLWQPAQKVSIEISINRL